MSAGEPVSAATVLSIVRDLTALTPDATRAETVRAGLEIAQHATSSHIAYLHFLNDDQNTIELGAWSQETMSYCTAVYDRHYPITQAGIWADSARLRKPCVHNDYEHMTDRRGLPDGHSRLVRHMGVPVVDEGAVRMLVGVGNKDSDYTETDLALLEIAAARIWSVLKQRVLFEEFTDLRTQFHAIKQVASAFSFSYDVDDDVLRCDGFFTTLLDALDAPTTLDGFLAFVVPTDRARIAAALKGKGGTRRSWWLHCRRDDGQVFLAELKLQFRKREIGEGTVVVGTVQDLSDRIVAQRRTGREDRDFLTGLPNQAGLMRQVQQASRRHPRQSLSVHAVEVQVPGAGPTRQSPLVTDEVLRVCARRLQQATGAHDLIACVADGVFEVVERGAYSSAESVAAARRFVAALSQPVSAAGQDIHPRVAAGLAVDLEGREAFAEVRMAAERALHEALEAGDGSVVVATPPS